MTEKPLSEYDRSFPAVAKERAISVFEVFRQRAPAASTTLYEIRAKYTGRLKGFVLMSGRYPMPIRQEALQFYVPIRST
ncbi:MAG: hypothetical protein EKK53_26650 [Burkholderiales bacterium]|nr:MAG: hypothetical protein EKK53_26650 [Burkholderiales bacterium]